MSKVYNYLLYIGLTFILVFSPLARGAVRIWSITPILLVIYSLVFLWLWQNRRTPYAVRRTEVDKPIIGFAILAVTSFVFSIYKHDSFLALLRLFAYIGLYYLILNNYSRSLRRYLIGLVICMGTGLSIYGLLQYFNVLPHRWWIPEFCLASTYVNHNHFSGYLELVIPAAIGTIIHYKKMKSTVRLLLIEASAVMIAAFIFAQSRGAWICLSVSLLVMNLILVSNNKLNKTSTFILILLIIAIFSIAYIKSTFIAERLETLTEVSEGEASFATRLKIWEGTIDMICHNPVIGTGIGTFIWGFPRYRPEGLFVKANFAHNDYIHMAAEMGILAPVIMLWIFIIVIGRGLGRYERRETRDERRAGIHPVILGCAIGMLSLMLHGLVDFNFHIPANMILFVVFGAFVIKEGGGK